MAIEFKKGNIFNAKTQAIVNTVNCVGVMGKGIALVYKLRYPLMFDIYKDHCKKKLINIGKLWLYKGQSDAPWVLNFPTKYHWKYPSKIEFIEKGLDKFVSTYKDQGINSIAFPLLGTHNGGLDKEEVLRLMQEYLGRCDIAIEIYDYDPSYPDDLYEAFSIKWTELNKAQIKLATAIRQDRIDTISHVIQSGKIRSMIDFINEPGIGLKTMEQCFSFVMSHRNY